MLWNVSIQLFLVSCLLLNVRDGLCRFGGDLELHLEVCGDFLDQAEQRMELMYTVPDRGRLWQLTLLAHSVKGNCGIIGAERCQKLAHEVEMSSPR